MLVSSLKLLHVNVLQQVHVYYYVQPYAEMRWVIQILFHLELCSFTNNTIFLDFSFTRRQRKDVAVPL